MTWTKTPKDSAMFGWIYVRKDLQKAFDSFGAPGMCFCLEAGNSPLFPKLGSLAPVEKELLQI